MGRVIGIGETIFDIIFDRNNCPVSAKPGGSVYNSLISLGRCGIDTAFISEVGNDHVGNIIKEFLVANGVDVSLVCSFEGGKSPLALAFLDENQNANYQFYKDYAAQRLQFTMPTIGSNDIVLIGSYFAISPVIREQVRSFLQYARQCGALIYYDVNFRATHCHEAEQLMPTIIENFQFADVVKGSNEDFMNMFGTTDWHSVYTNHIAKYCSAFVCTCGEQGATMLIDDDELTIPATSIVPLSTVGAGDSFNAGMVYGFVNNGINRDNLHSRTCRHLLSQSMACGVDFATEVCLSYDNYVAYRKK